METVAKNRSQKKLVDQYFDRYAASHQNATNKLIHWICVPLIVFGLLGLVWAIPFPHLDFLGRYNGFLNWASFLIAFALYFYYRLSPTLFYGMILVVFAFSFLIVQLEMWEKNGGPALWQSSLVIFILAWVGLFTGYKIAGKKTSFPDDLKILLIGPIWLLHFLYRKMGIPY